MRGIGVSMLALLCASAATGAVQQPATTVQQDFERATALSNGTDRVAALAAWQALETRTAANKRNHAIVLVRKSEILFDLDHKDDAVAAARAGLADLPASDHSLDGDRMRAYLNLGAVAEASLDYAGAADFYRTALSLAVEPADKLKTLRGLIQTEIFTDPDAAAGPLDTAEAMIGTLKVDKSVRAMVERLRGQWLLAKGRYAEAAQIEKAAVKDLGGLTLQVNVEAADARSDAAIALLLAGKAEDAREYMAYTGAGRLPEGGFDPGQEMQVPYCGDADQLRPEDAAVIEFRVDDNGQVVDSVPVYAAGGGAAALAFARAARDWSWTPEEAKHLPPFFRYSARVELRCSTAFERPSIESLVDEQLGTWLQAKGVALPPPITGSDAAALPIERRRLAEQEAAHGRDALLLVPTLISIANNAVSGREETLALATRAAGILAANGAPPMAQLAADRIVWAAGSAESWRSDSFVAAVRPHLADRAYAADPQARATIRLMLADHLQRQHESDASQLLQQVADDAALDKNDPLKVGALIRLASIDADNGNLAGARAAFDQSGLSADQCALLDSQPQMIASSHGTDQFPMEAFRWGFEGWTQVQFDVTADGHPQNVRAILSYPPFVFTKAGATVVDSARFSKSYRPDGGLGCGGTMQRVKFRIP